MNFFFDRIAYEGRKKITVSFLLAFVCIFCDFSFVFLIIFIFFLYLYYIPKDNIENFEENVVYAPIEGEIIDIKENIVKIYTNVLDKSILKSPINGKITKKSSVHGVFLNADLEKSKKLNDRLSFLIRNEKCQIEISSLSDKFGFLGHSFYKNKNQEIKTGENIGFCANSIITIKLPKNADIKVNICEKIVSNDILAILRKNSEQA